LRNVICSDNNLFLCSSSAIYSWAWFANSRPCIYYCFTTRGTSIWSSGIILL